MTFDLDLYLQGHSTLTLKIVSGAGGILDDGIVWSIWSDLVSDIARDIRKPYWCTGKRQYCSIFDNQNVIKGTCYRYEFMEWIMAIQYNVIAFIKLPNHSIPVSNKWCQIWLPVFCAVVICLFLNVCNNFKRVCFVLSAILRDIHSDNINMRFTRVRQYCSRWLINAWGHKLFNELLLTGPLLDNRRHSVNHFQMNNSVGAIIGLSDTMPLNVTRRCLLTL